MVIEQDLNRTKISPDVMTLKKRSNSNQLRFLIVIVGVLVLHDITSYKQGFYCVEKLVCIVWFEPGKPV